MKATVKSIIAILVSTVILITSNCGKIEITSKAAVTVAAAAAKTTTSSNSSSDSKNIKDQLSKKVTSGKMPGTYQASDGSIFAISVLDESIFDINVALSQIFKGKDWSICQVVAYDEGWLNENGIIDIGDKTIQIAGDENETYNYKFSGTKLTITNQSGKKKSFSKISDEYNPKVVCKPSLITADILVGLYEETVTGGYGKLPNYVKIEKVNKDYVNVYHIKKYDQQDYRLIKMAENVPINTFTNNGAVCLKGETSFKVRSVRFVSRDLVELEIESGTTFGDTYQRKSNNKLDISSIVKDFKSKHSKMNYDYSSFTDVTTLIGSANEMCSVNTQWYKYYTSYTARIDRNSYGKEPVSVNLTVKNGKNNKIELYFNNKLLYSTNSSDYSLGSGYNKILYHCGNGIDFEFHLEVVDERTNSFRPIIYFKKINLSSIGINDKFDEGLEFVSNPEKDSSQTTSSSVSSKSTSSKKSTSTASNSNSTSSKSSSSKKSSDNHTVWTVRGAGTGEHYLALRTAKAFDASNEIGKLYDGEKVYVYSYSYTEFTETYWYVYSPKLDKWGYVNSNFIYDY